MSRRWVDDEAGVSGDEEGEDEDNEGDEGDEDDEDDEERASQISRLIDDREEASPPDDEPVPPPPVRTSQSTSRLSVGPDVEVFDALVDAVTSDPEPQEEDGHDDDGVEDAFRTWWGHTPPDFSTVALSALDDGSVVPSMSAHATNTEMLKLAGLAAMAPGEVAQWLVPLNSRGVICSVLQASGRVGWLAAKTGLPDPSMVRKQLELAFYFDLHFVEMVAFRNLVDQVDSLGAAAVAEKLDAERLGFLLATAKALFRPLAEPHSRLCMFNVVDPQETLRPLFVDLRETPTMQELVGAPDELTTKAVTNAMRDPLTAVYQLTTEAVRRPFLAWFSILSKLLAAAGDRLGGDSRTMLQEVQVQVEMQLTSLQGLAMAMLQHYNFRMRPQDPSKIRVTTYSDFLDEKSPKSNILYTRLLDLIYREGYRKDDRKRVVRAKYVDGHFAYAYEVAFDTVGDMLYSLHSCTLNPALIEFMVLGENVFKTFAQRMENTEEEVFFPTIKRDRNVISFRDGILDIKNLVFVRHSHSSAGVFPRDGCASVYHDVDIGAWWDVVKDSIYPRGHVPSTPAQAAVAWKKMRAVRNYKGVQASLKTAAARRTQAQIMRYQQQKEAEREAEREARREAGASQELDDDALLESQADDAQAMGEIRQRGQLMEAEASSRHKAETKALFADNAEYKLFLKHKPFFRKAYAEIDTPAVESVIMYQLVEQGRVATAENQREFHAVLAMLGRLLFDLRELDNFDIMPWFEGPGGCGKSSILTLVKMCFDPNDVAIMSNVVEEQFGTSPLSKAKVILGYEIGLGFKLPHQTWLSMVVGEMLSSAAKFKDPIMAMWKAAMVFVGNGFPAWADQQGQTSRRIFHFHMRRIVTEQNLRLGDEMNAERGAYILKAVCAYHDLLYRVGCYDQVWKHLPERFVQARKALQVRLNVVLDFIFNGEQVRIDPDQAIQASVFRSRLTAYCTTAKKTAPASMEEIVSIIAQFDANIRPDTRDGILYIVGLAAAGSAPDPQP